MADISTNDNDSLCTNSAGGASTITLPGLLGGLYYVTLEGSGTSMQGSYRLVLEELGAPPVISNCPMDMTVVTDPGSCLANVIWVEPTVNNDYGLQSFAPDIPVGSSFGIGTTKVTYLAVDDLNTVVCDFDVTVTDGEDPTIMCTNFVGGVDSSMCQGTVTVPAPTVSDNCGVASLLNLQNGTSNASGMYPIGLTTVDWKVEDAAGNSATCAMDIIILDDEAPMIECPFDVVTTVLETECDAFISMPLATGSDNCSLAMIENDFNGTSDGSDTYPTGITEVTWTATDNSGNISTCRMNVTIDHPVTVTVPGDLSVCEGDILFLNASVTGGNGTYMYEWFADSTSLGMGNAVSHIPMFTTVYSVLVTDDSTGCVFSESFIATVDNNLSDCSNPTSIGLLPYIGNGFTTVCSGNDIGSADGCGNPYLDGSEYFFTYTADSSRSLDLMVSNTGPSVGIFVFDDCPTNLGSNCLAQSTSATGNPTLDGLNVLAGEEYYIVVAAAPTAPETAFDLTINPSSCGRDIFEPNDTDVEAAELPDVGVNHNAAICEAGDADWYWYIAKHSNVQFTLSGLAIDCGMIVRNGNVSTFSDVAGTDNEVINLSSVIPGDTLLVWVFGNSSASSREGYSLHVVDRATTIAASREDESSLAELSLEEGFTVYPNPVKDILHIRGNGLELGDVEFILYDSQGREVIHEFWQANGMDARSLNLSDLQSGMYYYRLNGLGGIQSGEIVRM